MHQHSLSDEIDFGQVKQITTFLELGSKAICTDPVHDSVRDPLGLLTVLLGDFEGCAGGAAVMGVQGVLLLWAS